MKYLVLFSAMLLSACAGNKEIGGAPNLTVMEGGLPVPDDAAQLSGRGYVIGPLDRLTVDVFGIEGMEERELQVDSAGRISFPIAGVIDAGGRSPEEVETMIRSRLQASYIRDPQVSVNLKETLSKFFTVTGEVQEPGRFPAANGTTLLQAVARARGGSEFADLGDVVVFREAEGRKYAALYNLKAISRGRYEDPPIYADDIIVVGDSTARKMFRDGLAILPALTTPLVVWLQN